MDERRREARERSFLGASIGVSSQLGSMSCLVRNLTSTGAKVSFSEAVPLPQDINFAVPNRGISLRARVMWRGGGELGVQFLETFGGTATADVVSLKEVRRLKACQRENDALKRRIEELTSGI